MMIISCQNFILYIYTYFVVVCFWSKEQLPTASIFAVFGMLLCVNLWIVYSYLQPKTASCNMWGWNNLKKKKSGLFCSSHYCCVCEVVLSESLWAKHTVACSRHLSFRYKENEGLFLLKNPKLVLHRCRCVYVEYNHCERVTCFIILFHVFLLTIVAHFPHSVNC